MTARYDRAIGSPRYSFVIPVFNERESLPELYRRVSGRAWTLSTAPRSCSSSTTAATTGRSDLLIELQHGDPRVKVIRFARNFGHQIAITAGLDFATGDAVIVMDADLQDPPEVVPELVARWQEGYEVVYAVREEREGESWLKRTDGSVVLPPAPADRERRHAARRRRLPPRRPARARRLPLDEGADALRPRHVQLGRLSADRRPVPAPRALRRRAEVLVPEVAPPRGRTARQLLERPASAGADRRLSLLLARVRRRRVRDRRANSRARSSSPAGRRSSSSSRSSAGSS